MLCRPAPALWRGAVLALAACALLAAAQQPPRTERARPGDVRVTAYRETSVEHEATDKRGASGKREASEERKATEQRHATGERDASNERQATEERETSGEREVSDERDVAASQTGQREASAGDETVEEASGERETSGEREVSQERKRPGERQVLDEPKATSEPASTGEHEATEEHEAAREGEATAELDDESDSAPFAVLVTRGDGRSCGGALVSLRAALSSAWCASDAPELRVMPGGRRVSRVALASDGGARGPALLELQAPVEGARPILMATRGEECAVGAACHAVRALPRPARWRIVDVSLVSRERCGATLCAGGPALCWGEPGAAVVCGGKLCGVLSDSAECGVPHGVHSVSRWRRFLHCAHTLSACAGSGECARLCTERWLLTAPPTAATALTPRRVAPASDTTPLLTPAAALTSFEYEPNRADFKAGEYGDNAAQYGGDERLQSPAPPARPAPLPPVSPAPGEPPARSSSLSARRHPSSSRKRTRSAERSAAPRAGAWASLLPTYVLLHVVN